MRRVRRVRATQAKARKRSANRSVAIVGASPTPGALGASVLANLVRMGFAGAIHLINPKRDEIFVCTLAICGTDSSEGLGPMIQSEGIPPFDFQ